MYKSVSFRTFSLIIIFKNFMIKVLASSILFYKGLYKILKIVLYFVFKYINIKKFTLLTGFM